MFSWNLVLIQFYQGSLFFSYFLYKVAFRICNKIYSMRVSESCGYPKDKAGYVYDKDLF